MNFPDLIYVVDNDSNMSQPAYDGDVGYDVVAASEPRIVGSLRDENLNAYKSIDYIEYDLNIKIDGFQPVNSPNDDIYTLVFPRSSVSRYNLLLANSVAVIDSGFRSTIKVRFKYVVQPEDLMIVDGNSIVCIVNPNKIYKSGDKICQLVFQKHFHPSITFVSQLEQSERNEGGFGSTGL
jgi:dUTPase